MSKRTEYSRFIQNVHCWDQLQKSRMIALLHSCIAAGITSFDVADFLGRHWVGAEFGAALSESGLSRDQFQLVARVGEVEPSILNRQLDALLLDLKTDYIDILLLGQDPGLKTVSGALKKMFIQGKFHEIGSLGLPTNPLDENESQSAVFQLSFAVRSEEILKRQEKQKKNGEKYTLFMDWPAQEIDRLSLGMAFEDLQIKYKLSYKQLLLVGLVQHPVNMHLDLEGKTQKEIQGYGGLEGVRLQAFDWQKISLIFTG